MAAIAQLVITLTDTNQIEVNGPVDNKGLCYMMLECARDAVHEQSLKTAVAMNGGGIVVPKVKLHGV